MAVMIRVFAIDDTSMDSVRDALKAETPGFYVTHVATIGELNQHLVRGVFDVVLTDLGVLGFEGLSVLTAIRSRDPEVPIIVITDRGSEEIAVLAMKGGASDYIRKTAGYEQQIPAAILSALRATVAQRDRRQTLARLAAIVEASDDAIFSASLDGTIASWNNGAARLYGYSASEVVGQPVTLLVPPELRGELSTMLARIGTGERITHVDTKRLRRDGGVVEVAVTLSPIRDAAGQPVAVAAIEHDLTERRRTADALRMAELQLQQAQRMEAIGRLAGGVAHDFNNILSVVISYSSWALDELGSNDVLRDDIAEILRAGRRAADLTRQLLAFSRRQMLRPEVFDINEVVVGMEKMLQRLIGADVQLGLLIRPDIGMVMADQGQIEQVIMNLVVNARDAMPSGGRLTIETSAVTLDESSARSLAVAAGPYVKLVVADTGIGMDTETQARMFDPFFTTKDRGKGTGLGLATVFGIVKQSNGAVVCKSAPGRGASFSIVLPRTQAAPRPASTSSLSITRPTGSETILLVEDEAQVRDLVRNILRRHGYTVLEAHNAGDALLICEQTGQEIDLLLTDVVMPLLSGHQLADRLVRLRPGMRVLFMSGYTNDSEIAAGRSTSDINFLPKPITPEALADKVREVLDFSAA